ncbi:MAG: hypothetical protein WCA85_16565 [Paraburkholderia sp.]|uniref:hypothetical protein n=1 Tax=Paraburkholderia sp. TaxID=1926495 RepID=UPI003C3B8BC4
MHNSFDNYLFPGRALFMLRALVRPGATKRSVLLVSVSLMSACTTVSTVDSRQDGHLVLTSRARCSLTSWNHVKNVGLKHAAAYCNKQKSRFHLVAVHTEGVWGATDQVIEVVFDCI